MNILVIGCSTVGVEIAMLLNRAGHDVSVVDSDRLRFNDLGADFNGIITVGNPIDQETLQNAGIKGCDAVVVSTDSDNINIMAAQIAKKVFNVPKVVVSVINPLRENVFCQFDLSTVCPTRMTADAFVSALLNDFADERITVGTCTVGIRLREIDPSKGTDLQSIIASLSLQTDETLIGIQRPTGNVLPVSRLEAEYEYEKGDKALLTRIID